MAVLSDQDRSDIHAAVMQDLSKHTESCTVSKPNLRGAIDAIDQWVSDNATSLNTAIPQPARGQLTASQKARLLMLVVRKRFDKGV